MQQLMDRVADSLPTLNTDPDGESPECPVCHGVGWVTPEFGARAVPCRGCPAPLGYFFQHLEVTEDNEAAMEAAIRMAWEPEGWLVLVGKHGVGKTTILEAIASEWDGHKAIPFTAVALLDYLQDFEHANFQARFRQVEEKALFALDDLAIPKATDWSIPRLTELIDYRYARRLPTVITLDKDEEQLAEKFGVSMADRVFDRGTGLVRVVSVKGESYRTGRKW